MFVQAVLIDTSKRRPHLFPRQPSSLIFLLAGHKEGRGGGGGVVSSGNVCHVLNERDMHHTQIAGLDKAGAYNVYVYRKRCWLY